jgi:hypothetical protein
MTPEEAAKGLLLLEELLDENPDTGSNLTYRNLKEQQVFWPYSVYES